LVIIPVKTGIQASYSSDGYPPLPITTGASSETAGMTDLGCHSRHCLSGIYLGFLSDGYLPQTRRYDKGEMDACPCQELQGQALRHAGMTNGGWSTATNQPGWQIDWGRYRLNYGLLNKRS